MKSRSSFLIIFFAFLAFPLLVCLLISQARLVVKPEAVTKVDKSLTQLAGVGTFSGTALIAQDGVVFLSKGYGLADRSQNIANALQTRFHLGSMSKQFTAMGILILEAQGKLSVQDPICVYITDCPKEWQDITIHHLLTHTSGLSDIQSSWLDTAIQTASSGPVAPVEQAKYLGFSIRWFLDAQPGEQFVYSNFGYHLLAYIIEQASGQTYADFLNQAIFTPLNMHNTGYQNNSSGVASTYLNRDTLEAEQFGPYPVPDGSDNIYSTGEDLLHWDQALNTDQLLPRAELDQMFTPYASNSALPGFGYGYGLFVTKILGRPIFLSTGGGHSFVTAYFRLPEDGLTLVVLTNQGALDFISMMNGIVLSIASALFLIDLIFALTTIAFMLLLAVLLAAQMDNRVKTKLVTEMLWFLLIAPFTLVFIRFLIEKRGVLTLLPFGLFLFYMLVKSIQKLVLRIDFMKNKKLRNSDQLFMCISLLSLIWVTFTIHPSWGIHVLFAFGILIFSYFYKYRNEIRITRSNAISCSSNNDGN